ncbi:hypothetical protein ACE3NQ_08370 [Paenibacillus terreus]|uniref:Uncharacterized protein n=1 Tax=Paenibacillus terreus TaxID=1387834 RepID=A0ABV5B8P5_9BACL
MIEINLQDIAGIKNNRARVNIIKTAASQKKRPEDEMVILMKAARNRFNKAVSSGRIEIVGEREWMLH